MLLFPHREEKSFFVNAINSTFARVVQRTSKAAFDPHPAIISLKRKVSPRGEVRGVQRNTVLYSRILSSPFVKTNFSFFPWIPGEEAVLLRFPRIPRYHSSLRDECTLRSAMDLPLHQRQFWSCNVNRFFSIPPRRKGR